jgi:hypothetical protein
MVLCAAAASLIVSCGKQKPRADSSTAPAADSRSQDRANPNLVRPPDLDLCSRIEVRYSPSPLGCLFPSVGEPNVLNEEEKKYLEAPDPIVVRDPERITAFAKEILSGTFEEERDRPFGYPLASVCCYATDGKPLSLTVYDSTVVTPDNRGFHYSGENHPWRRGPLLGTLLALTPEIRAFDLRAVCARNIWYARSGMDVGGNSVGNEGKTYPPASSWCDGLVALRGEWMLQHLKCPAVPEGRSHYAMNPHCRPDSPADMVLLFETKAGWNQHGGPELFTFDNHDPKGGCVVLNKGTVKFIRTEEELKQLRWK